MAPPPQPADARSSPPSGAHQSDGLELAPGLSRSDRDLIRLLQEDGRRSYARLAADLGTTEKAVRRRVNELRVGGIIEITTVADPELMGYQLTALLGIQVDPRERVSDVAQRLAHVTGAFYVVVVTGRYNVLVELSVLSTDHLLQIVDDEVAAVAGVRTVEVMPYLRLHYQNPSFEAATHKSAAADVVHRERIAFDETDREIISRLHDDGRTPYQALARDLAVSESQVRARVRRMVASGALRIMALTVPAGVGFHTVALIGVTLAPGVPAERVATALADLPSVIYVAICAGRFDLLAEAVCTDPEDLLRLLDEQIRPLEGLAQAEPWIYLRLHYRSVQPAPSA